MNVGRVGSHAGKKSKQECDQMEKFISCDWGTSSFRMRVVNSSDLSILAARETGQGIAATHTLWVGQPEAGQPESRYKGRTGCLFTKPFY